ncbi:hypothetical protein NUSPORA_00872 [Nucleospora cyclopteri]
MFAVKFCFLYYFLTFASNRAELRLKVIKNTPYETKIVLAEPALVIYMSNLEQGNFLFSTNIIHIKKPIRKIYDYEFDIERGVKIIIFHKDSFFYIRDGMNFIDFNSRCVGILVSGFIFAFMIRRIKNQHKGTI